MFLRLNKANIPSHFYRLSNLHQSSPNFRPGRRTADQERDHADRKRSLAEVALEERKLRLLQNLHDLEDRGREVENLTHQTEVWWREKYIMKNIAAVQRKWPKKKNKKAEDIRQRKKYQFDHGEGFMLVENLRELIERKKSY